ncbi:variable surface lipoprotein [Mycoplasmopsis bovis]|uniref:variable surface lipoprotein n=1 Tax=Mycoplasmopsis bovis TaxID=28903 RepID=UPI00094ACF08|nr:variable surface lipoprotein [Mycoplasmopsis bovis]
MKKNKLLLSLGSLSIFSAIPFVAAKCDNTETKDNNSSKEPGTTDPGTTEKENVKVDLDKLSDKVKEELNKLAKEKVTKEEVVAVLKTEKGLEKLTTEDLTKVEFKDNKLTIEANKDSKLVSGTHVFDAQVQPPKTDSVIDLSCLELNGEVKKVLKAEAKEKPEKTKILGALKKDKNFEKLTESDFEVSFKDSVLTITESSKSTLIKGKLTVNSKTELDNISLTDEIKKKLQEELQKSEFKSDSIVTVLKTQQELKELETKDVEAKKEGNKLSVSAKSDSAKFTGTLSFIFKVMLDKMMTDDVKKELSSEVKENPNTSNVVNALKKVPGLVTLSSNDVKIEFSSGKLVISATEESKLVIGSVSIEKSATLGKINLSTYNFDEKQKKDLLSAIDESNDEESDSRKTSVWFTLKGIFKNGLEESDFEIEVDKDKKSLTIKAAKDSKILDGEIKLNK